MMMLHSAAMNVFLPSELEEFLDVLDALSDNSPSSFVTFPSFLQVLQADWHYKQSA